MKRKILAILLVISLIAVPSARNLPEAHANPILKEAVKVVIKQAIKKETKSAVESQLIKSGVRTVEKTALERANERWFQRLAADEVASLTSAVERATPAGTPGWLKIVVGAGMFATGADLAFDIYDALAVGNDVDYYTDDTANITTNKGLIGIRGYTLKWRPSSKGANGSPLKYYDYYLESDSTGEQFNNQTMQATPESARSFYYLKDLGYSKDKIKLGLFSPHLSYNLFTGVIFIEGPDYNKKTYNVPMTSDSYYKYKNSDNKFDFDTSSKSKSQLYSMPEDMKDVWPGETEAVEITFPDPDFFPDTTQTILDNPDIITNPFPEPQPTLSPTVQPTTDPNPSAQPTPNPGYTPEPPEGPAPSASPNPSIEPTPSAIPSTQPTNPPVIGGEDPNPTTAPDDDDDDDGYNGPPIDSPLTPEEALALGWEDVTPPLIKEYKDPKTGTVVKFNTKTLEITYTKYFEVEIINTEGKPIGEIDEIDMEKEIFYEDKQAKGLNIINPSTGLPAQTAQQWADKQILVKTRNRIQALRDGTATRVTKNGSKIIPQIESIRNFKEFVFRLDGDSLELKQATENVVNLLTQEFPGYKFSATFGRK